MVQRLHRPGYGGWMKRYVVVSGMDRWLAMAAPTFLPYIAPNIFLTSSGLAA